MDLGYRPNASPWCRACIFKQVLSDEEAEQNLRNYLGDAAKGLTARKISFESGYREKFWHKNCCCSGNVGRFCRAP
ncbi:tryptophan 7-halogenase [Pseudoalteromonas sp. Hal099]